MLIKFLLESGSAPNVFNKHTGFTPMHWCARYGELDSVIALCNAGAKEPLKDNVASIPDFMGFTPLDYAGKFAVAAYSATTKKGGESHWKVVDCLVRRLWKRCREEIAKVKREAGQNASGTAHEKMKPALELAETAEKGKHKADTRGQKSRSWIPCLKSGEKPNIFDHTEFLVSPILRSTILFWACYLPEEVLTWKEIRQII